MERRRRKGVLERIREREIGLDPEGLRTVLAKLPLRHPVKGWIPALLSKGIHQADARIVSVRTRTGRTAALGTRVVENQEQRFYPFEIPTRPGEPCVLQPMLRASTSFRSYPHVTGIHVMGTMEVERGADYCWQTMSCGGNFAIVCKEDRSVYATDRLLVSDNLALYLISFIVERRIRFLIPGVKHDGLCVAWKYPFRPTDPPIQTPNTIHDSAVFFAAIGRNDNSTSFLLYQARVGHQLNQRTMQIRNKKPFPVTFGDKQIDYVAFSDDLALGPRLWVIDHDSTEDPRPRIRCFTPVQCSIEMIWETHLPLDAVLVQLKKEGECVYGPCNTYRLFHDASTDTIMIPFHFFPEVGARAEGQILFCVESCSQLVPRIRVVFLQYDVPLIYNKATPEYPILAHSPDQSETRWLIQAPVRNHDDSAFWTNPHDGPFFDLFALKKDELPLSEY